MCHEIPRELLRMVNAVLVYDRPRFSRYDLEEYDKVRLDRVMPGNRKPAMCNKIHLDNYIQALGHGSLAADMQKTTTQYPSCTA